MRKEPDPFRTPGKILSVKHEFEERAGHMVCWIFFDYEDGGTQGFGGITLGKKGGDLERAWITELCRTFQVSGLEQLEGVRCYSLREFDEHNTPIVGLEALDGSRFTIKGFLKRNLEGYESESALANQTRRIRANIAFLERRISEEKERIERLSKDFRDWGE